MLAVTNHEILITIPCSRKEAICKSKVAIKRRRTLWMFNVLVIWNHQLKEFWNGTPAFILLFN